MNDSVLVTGATGTLGKAIVEAAVNAGISVRQGVRSQAKANPRADAAHLDYADPATVPPALAGASAVVLMAPPLDPNAPAQLRPVISAAKAANVRHLILISAFGVNHNEQAPLRVVEHLVMDSGVPFTILRPNFFMENFSEGAQVHGIRQGNAIHLAAGDGKTSFISVRDVASAVVAALQQSPSGREFDLTGPAALDHADVARIIGEASGRSVVYQPLTDEQMLEGARAHGMPEPSVAYLGILYSVVRAGFAASVAGDYEALTGRKPTTFEAFAKSSAAAWS